MTIKPVAGTSAAATTSDAPPGQHNYEVAVIQKHGIDIPDPEKVKWQGFACIPLPIEYTRPTRELAIMRGPAVPPKVKDATSYEEMWAGFAWGRTVPDPFRCLFQAIGIVFTPYEACVTMCGYALARRITIQLNNVFNQDVINTFLVTLTTFDCSLQLTAGQNNLWSNLLACESDHPVDNWNELCSFMNIDTYPWEDFGLSFTAPTDTSQPREIHTRWR